MAASERSDSLWRHGQYNALGETTYVCDDNSNTVPDKLVKYNMTQKTTLLPVPLTELQANPNLAQNDGYSFFDL